MADTDVATDSTVRTRGYQQEMLEESLKRNIIVAMGTGSGKTHIAVLRLKIEAEREPHKLSWFLAPTVVLCEQQKGVIEAALPVNVGLISGSLEPEQWKNAELWRSVIASYRIMVTTPQVLLDALRHGYIHMGQDIGLIIFDEVHNATGQAPYSRIMQEFYLACPPRAIDSYGDNANVRPQIMGLTASPIFGGNAVVASRALEATLDCTIRSPRRSKEELEQFVHIPVFKHVLYCSEPLFSTNLASFNNIFRRLDIEADPFVKSLRKKLAKTTPGTPDWKRLDQQLSKTVSKKNTYTHSGLRHVSETGQVICSEIGPWAADWYICRVLELAKSPVDASSVVSDLNHSERGYLLKILDKVVVSPVSFEPEDIADDLSDKVRHLVACLQAEKSATEDRNEAYSGLIFVERREAVLVLAEVLSHHPETKGVFKVGTLVGGVDNGYKTSPLDITRTQRKVQDLTLVDFKIGEKNVIVSTSVAEEGIDIQACCSVIRFDPPKNMAGWAQSRGRARRQHSTFTLMFDDDAANRKNVNDWERLEAQMMALYNDPSRDLMSPADDLDDEDDNSLELKVESTGARLSLHGVISHLNHFCAVIPNSSHIDHKPIFDVDPPEMPEGWHSFENRTTAITPYPGPFGAKVTLPRLLPKELRFFETERIHRSKLSAFRHVAMKAYRALYENGLLNDNLLPLTSVGDPSLEEEVQALLKEVEKRAGTARVSIQMDPWSPADETTGWYSSEIVITGLPPLLLFTRVRPTEWSDKTAPILHRIGWQGSVTLRPISFDSSPETIARARDYTRRLFWCINGSRMNWDDLDFSYLFLSLPGSDDAAWDSRRLWHAQQDLRGDSPFLANALALGEQFSYPSDLTLIRNGPKFNKAYTFVRWRFEPLNSEEEEDFRTLYARFPNIEITYPLLVVESLPPRTNFLIPVPESANLSASQKTFHLLPRLAYATLVSEAEVQYAFLLPSALRSLAMAMTVDSLRDTLFSNSHLASAPQQLLITAMSAPVSQEKSNYQRLETLGDTVLKFLSSLQFLGEYPLWHEGYLTKKMGLCVSNGRLAKANIAHGLYKWIIRDRMLGKKWKPSYFTVIDMMEDSTTTEVEDVDEDMDGKKRKKGKQDLSTKVLADVVESLIGAFYLHGGFPLALECAQFFDLGIKWQPLPARIEAMLNRVETHDELPSQLDSVEEMLGYTFTRKLLLVEALTHASYQQDLRTISYERLEFAGDAVLDMIVTEHLFHAEGKDYSPGHMFHRKSAMVNASILAFFCLGTHIDKDTQMPRATGGPHGNRKFTLQAQSQQTYLWQCLLHSNSRILDDQRTAFARYLLRRDEIDEGLQRGQIFPWAALTRLQAPKFLSDMIESLIGAVFLDSSGNLDTVRGVLRKLGWMQVLERMVCADVDVLHPVSQLNIWASKNGKKLAYDFIKEKGDITCAVLVDGEEVEGTRVTDRYQGKLTQDEVRLVAAEKAIVQFRLRDVNVNYTALKHKTTKKRKRSSSLASLLKI